MAFWRWFLASALGLVLLLATRGTSSANVLVLDVCMQKCTDDDWRAITNIRLVLQSEVHNSYLVASVEEMIYRLGGSVPFPGIDDPNLTAQQLAKELQDGIGLWAAGDHETAAESLKGALAKALANPALVADDATLRRLVQKAYIGRSVSLYRLKRTNDVKDPNVVEAMEAMGDMVRMTPEASIKDIWGRKPDEVFQMARGDLIARGTGTLSIQINDPTAVFYLHPAGEPRKGAFTGEVFSGVYHIFVTDAENRCRRYSVVVAPHQHAVLNIDWRRDTRIEVRLSRPPQDGRPWIPRDRIGFTFSSFAERRREADYASDVSARVPGSLVLVVGRIKWEGKDALIGALYAPEQPAARVGIALGTDLSAARDLAFFLMTDKPAPRIIQLAVTPWEVPSPPSRGSDDLSSDAKWVIIGVGALAIATGATLYAINRAPDRNTAPYGIGLGAVGVAAVGLGFWFGRTPTSAPVVSVSSSHAMIGWAGSF
jgi:hypothetical protein